MAQQTVAVSGIREAQPAIECGLLRLDLNGLAVFVDGRDVRVTYSEFLLLRALASQPYRVLDRAALVNAIRRGDPDSADLRLIDRHVARLRRKLRDAGYDCIQTMRFAGYRFAPPAACEADAGAPTARAG